MNMSKENNASSSDSFDPRKLAVEYLTPQGRRGYRKPAIDGQFIDEKIAYADGHLAIRRWGDGRTVLLVHGWAGSQSDMHGLVPAVVEAGFCAITVDLPAHGDSVGDTASLDQLADAIVHVANGLGPLHAVIAHSVGCAATMIAATRGLSASRLVFLASPQNYKTWVYEFASLKGLSEIEAESVIEALIESGVRVDIFASELLPQIDIPGLIIHSNDDDVINVETGKQIAASWKSSRFIEVQGLGHRKILRDSQVINAVIDFICEKSPDQSSNQLETSGIRNYV
jgi:pimeloyl-ACP methyl ester carboxylesterase